MDDGTTDVLTVIITEPDTEFVIGIPEGILSGRTDSQGRAVNAVPEDILAALEALPPMYEHGVEIEENRLEYEVHRAEDYFRGFKIFDDVEHAVIAAKALGFGMITAGDKPWQRLDDWDRQFKGFPDRACEYLLEGNRLYKIQAVRFLGYDHGETS